MRVPTAHFTSRFTLFSMCAWEFALISYHHAFPNFMDSPFETISPNKLFLKLPFVMVFFQSNRNVTNTESSVVSDKNPTMLFFGGMWKTLELWTRKVVKYCKQNIMAYSSGSVKVRSAESSEGLPQRASYGNKDFISNRARDYFYDILAKKSVFCVCPENLCEAKLKRNKLLGV